jgi:hypothetical protein
MESLFFKLSYNFHELYFGVISFSENENNFLVFSSTAS